MPPKLLSVELEQKFREDFDQAIDCFTEEIPAIINMEIHIDNIENSSFNVICYEISDELEVLKENNFRFFTIESLVHFLLDFVSIQHDESPMLNIILHYDFQYQTSSSGKARGDKKEECIFQTTEENFTEKSVVDIIIFILKKIEGIISVDSRFEIFKQKIFLYEKYFEPLDILEKLKEKNRIYK